MVKHYFEDVVTNDQLTFVLSIASGVFSEWQLSEGVPKLLRSVLH